MKWLLIAIIVAATTVGEVLQAWQCGSTAKSAIFGPARSEARWRRWGATVS